MEKGLSSCCLIGLMAFAPLLARAQAAVPPSDVDLKAAYCLGVVNAEIAAYTSEGISKEIADAQSDQVRLQAYVVSKLQYLDPTAMAVAIARGKSDITAAVKEVQDCNAATGGNLTQLVACTDQAPAVSRIRSCKGAAFLPY